MERHIRSRILFCGKNIKRDVGSTEFEDGIWCKFYEKSHANESEYDFHIIVESNIGEGYDVHATLSALGISPLQRRLPLTDGEVDFHFQNKFELDDVLKDSPFPVLMHFVANLIPTGKYTNEHKKEARKPCFPSSRENIQLLSENMEELLVSGTMSDVILCADSVEFKAHKSILSARSPVFKRIFIESIKKESKKRLSVPIISPDALKELLMYIYTGKITIEKPHNAVELYIAAQWCEISILRNECRDFLLKCINVKSVLNILRLAHVYNDKILKEKLLEFISKNFLDVKQQKKYEEFVKNEKDLVIEILNYAVDKGLSLPL